MPIVTVGTLLPEQTKLNKGGEERWVRGKIRLHPSCIRLLSQIRQSKLPFTFVTGRILPKSNVIILGEITEYLIPNSNVLWKTLEISKIITPENRILKEWNVTFAEATRLIARQDKKFLEKLGSLELLNRKMIIDLVGNKNHFADRLIELFKDKAYEKLTENPWQMINMIPYFTIKQADAVAEKLGIPLTDERRFNECFRYFMDKAFESHKNTYLLENEFIALYWSSFSDQMTLGEYKALALAENSPVKKTKLGYHPMHFYFAEKASYDVVLKSLTIRIPESYGDWAVRKAINDSSITPTEEQMHAVQGAFQTPLHIITGGPGTGKTTVLKIAIQKLMLLLNMDQWDERAPFLLIAPTGKAAYRMWEQTGVPAHTIHSAFRIIPDYGCVDVAETAASLSHVRYIIIDESSMLDTKLFGDMCRVLLKMDHLPFILLVGDADQLPPVQHGQVFTDLLKFLTRYAPERVTYLTVLKRQENGSSIPELSAFIKDGTFPDENWFQDKDDVFFVPSTLEAFPEILKKGVLEPKLDTIDTIQILTPYRNGGTPDTVYAINALTEPLYNPIGANPETASITAGNPPQQFHVGDKVINKQNRSERVINGSIGVIESMYTGGRDIFAWTITVDFDGQKETYTHDEFKQLELAYAITIHASQGSEYENVVMGMMRGSNNTDFLNRNLLYVAVTRASKKLVLLGQISAFKQVAATKQKPRRTALAVWLRQIESEDK